MKHKIIITYELTPQSQDDIWHTMMLDFLRVWKAGVKRFKKNKVEIIAKKYETKETN